MRFPLTPALSLGEWEKPLPFRMNNGAKGILQRGRFHPLSPRERVRWGERENQSNADARKSRALHHFQISRSDMHCSRACPGDSGFEVSRLAGRI
jgi:hypothetical protein